MASMFNPVNGKTGESTTDLDKLAEGTAFTFDMVKDFDEHRKVNGDDGLIRILF